MVRNESMRHTDPDLTGGRMFHYHGTLWLPRPAGEIFQFFSDARNLQQITPPWLDFSVLTPDPIVMHPGATIDYRLRIRFLPIRWKTEITVWEPPERFVDEQRKGPYKVWIHEHRFIPRENGTEVVDNVRYYPPGGWLTNALFVKRDVKAIFEFRRQKLTRLFPRPKHST